MVAPRFGDATLRTRHRLPALAVAAIPVGEVDEKRDGDPYPPISGDAETRSVKDDVDERREGKKDEPQQGQEDCVSERRCDEGWARQPQNDESAPGKETSPATQ
jgi:hypothetical protein